MPKVDKGNRRSRFQGSSANPALARAGAVNPLLNDRQTWSGRPLGLYSFPNPSDEVAYMRVEAANINNSEYELCFERDTLTSSEGTNYPARHTPTFSTDNNPLVLLRFADSQSQSGAMFVIPPRSRVHVALRLRQNRNNTLEFP